MRVRDQCNMSKVALIGGRGSRLLVFLSVRPFSFDAEMSKYEGRFYLFDLAKAIQRQVK